MDFDPRNYGDSRDRDHFDTSDERWLDDPRDEDDRERDFERDRDPRDHDPRDAFADCLELPRGLERELVRDRDRDYSLDGGDTRTLSIVGSFRVVPERDLRDARDDFDRRDRDLRHLEREGLIERLPLDGRDHVVALTDRGRELLERHQNRDSRERQVFYSGSDRARERSHDAQLYRAYLREAERLREREARIVRVQLDRELKREYQRFLHERNRDDPNTDGRPKRTREEVEAWAREHELPYFDEQVHFPDVRIEYIDVDGDVRHRDIEVTTEHYRGGHSAAAHRSGFSIHAGRSGGSSPDPHLAEEFL